MAKTNGDVARGTLFSYDELAARWQVPRSTVLDAAREGEIERTRTRGGVRFSEATVRAFEEKVSWVEGRPLDWSPCSVSVVLRVPGGEVEVMRDNKLIPAEERRVRPVEEPSPPVRAGRATQGVPPTLDNPIDILDLEQAVWDFYLSHNWWPTVRDSVVEGLDPEKYGYVTWWMIDQYCKEDRRGLGACRSLLILGGVVVKHRLAALAAQGLPDPTQGRARIRP